MKNAFIGAWIAVFSGLSGFVFYDHFKLKDNYLKSIEALNNWSPLVKMKTEAELETEAKAAAKAAAKKGASK